MEPIRICTNSDLNHSILWEANKEGGLYKLKIGYDKSMGSHDDEIWKFRAPLKTNIFYGFP